MSAPQESGTLEPAAAAAGGAPPPAPPTIAAGKGTGAVGGMDDADEAAAKQTFDAALVSAGKHSFCQAIGTSSNVHYVYVPGMYIQGSVFEIEIQKVPVRRWP